MGVLTFLHFTVSLYTSQAGLRLNTFFHPIHPFNLTVGEGGGICTTHSGFLLCCWLGHLLLLQCEHIEVRGASEQRHRCRLWADPGPLRHTSSAQALYKEGGFQVLLGGLGHYSSSL